MRIIDVCTDVSKADLTTNPPPEMDPLRENDALQEAQLVDVRVDALRGTLAILFDLRMALQLREPNAGVIVARGVRDFRWTAPYRDTPLTAWSADGSLVSQRDGLFSIDFGLWPAPGATLHMSTERAWFVFGSIPDLPDTPPDYHESPAVNELVTWDSLFEPHGFTQLD